MVKEDLGVFLYLALLLLAVRFWLNQTLLLGYFYFGLRQHGWMELNGWAGSGLKRPTSPIPVLRPAPHGLESLSCGFLCSLRPFQ